jgi:hypothetical protein
MGLAAFLQAYLARKSSWMAIDAAPRRRDGELMNTAFEIRKIQ